MFKCSISQYVVKPNCKLEKLAISDVLTLKDARCDATVRGEPQMFGCLIVEELKGLSSAS